MSVLQTPENSGSAIFAKYGRSLPKRTWSAVNLNFVLVSSAPPTVSYPTIAPPRSMCSNPR